MTLNAINTTGTFGAPINAIQIIRATGDTDLDGMPDLWEDNNGLNKTVNDAALDPDSDSSPNLQEFQRNTNPQDNDSDNDGLLDGVETDTGTFVSPTNTGTDPLLMDTDGDGFADGIEDNSGTFVNETDPGTNPTKADTDNDGFADLEEVNLAVPHRSMLRAHRSCPRPSVIGRSTIRTWWPLRTFLRAEIPGTSAAVPRTWPGIPGTPVILRFQFNGTDAAVSTGFPLLDTRDAFTMTGFIKFSAAQADRTGLFGQNDCVEFGLISATTIELWTPTGGALQTPADPVDDDAWHHIAVVGDIAARRIYIDGALAASGAVGVPTAATGASFNIGGNGVYDAMGNFFNGTIDDVAVWDAALSATFIDKLADGTLSPVGPGAPPFNITAVSFNRTTRELTLTYESQNGQTYQIQRSDGATGVAWTQAGVQTATGASTSFTEVIPAGVTTRLYRVRSPAP